MWNKKNAYYTNQIAYKLGQSIEIVAVDLPFVYENLLLAKSILHWVRSLHRLN